MALGYREAAIQGALGRYTRTIVDKKRNPELARRGRVGSVLGGLLIALALSGCGSSEPEAASTSGSTASTSAPSTDTTSTTTPSSDTTKTEASTTGGTTANTEAMPTTTPEATGDVKLTGPKILVSLDGGKSFTLQLDTANAPKSSAGIEALVKKRFYDGTRVHRVEPGFCVQWGDPYSKNGVSDPRVGTGGSGNTLPFEPGKLPFVKGVLGVASKGAGTGGDGQIFVMTGDSPSLNGGYAAIGKVVKGMDVVEAIQVGDKVTSMKIVP